MKRFFSLLLLTSLTLTACVTVTSVPDTDTSATTKGDAIISQAVDTTLATEDETFTLDHLNISFTLPAKYWVYQTEGFEGAYNTTLHFGERTNTKSRSLKQAPLTISVVTGMTAGERTFGNPSEYIDYVLTEQHSTDALPVEATLFGNKAVTVTSAGDSSPTLIGQLRSDQIIDKQFAQNYFVTISAGTYGSGMTFDQDLYGTVVQSFTVDKAR